MSLYPFQERVYELLSSGRSVILQAPTGAGKTRAALYPFLSAWEFETPFPRKCIYSVPLRVLANQFWDEYHELVRRYSFKRSLDVTIQTGARPEDPKLEGNLVFTTIDQTLSNFLNIPYSLGLGQGNLNAGAVLSSYLVFDELHLFDPDTTLPTTLHLLRMLRGIVPFLVMTATFSTERVSALARMLGAEPLVLSADEAAAIPSEAKTRRIQTVANVLTADEVRKRHKERSVVICNTVDRAQTLFEELRCRVSEDVQIRLLHSRFLRNDRDDSETWLRREFGKEKDKYTVRSAILVATQVVEVGLDITSQALHTELAPASSIIQRAGRCARYEGEEGDVFVYRLPLNDKGTPRYAPYSEGKQADIIERTWLALAAVSGQFFDFGKELDVVDEAHGPADQVMMQKLRAGRFATAQQISVTIETQDRGAAAQLIRDVDSRTVIVHPEPKSIENPWVFDGFSIYRGSLLGAYTDLENLGKELNVDWVMMTADARPEEEENARARTVYTWRLINGVDDLVHSALVVINPHLASYSSETGFRLGVPGDPIWKSPLRPSGKKREVFPPYRRETLVEHIRRMTRVHDYPFYDWTKRKERRSLADELAFAGRGLERRFGWPPGTMDRLVRSIIAAHDLGKLDVRWQGWAHRWQEKVSKMRDEDMTIPDSYLAGHTDYDGDNEAEKAANRAMRHMRPNHAAESARAAANWLMDQFHDQVLARAAVTAIVRHHNAGTRGEHDTFKAHAASPALFPELLRAAGVEGAPQGGVVWSFPAGSEVVNRLIRSGYDEELLTYLLIVRALRLADQRSQEWRD